MIPRFEGGYLQILLKPLGNLSVSSVVKIRDSGSFGRKLGRSVRNTGLYETVVDSASGTSDDAVALTGWLLLTRSSEEGVNLELLCEIMESIYGGSGTVDCEKAEGFIFFNRKS